MKPQTILALTGLLVAALALTVACHGTLDLAVETAPGPEVTLAALETENAHLATQVAELEAQPDLGKVVYIQGGDVWVKNIPDGEPVRLTRDGKNLFPRLSPSGEWCLFRKGPQVWVMRTWGSDAHPLNGGMGVDVALWSPVEDRVAYVTGWYEGGLFLVNADGSDERIIVPYLEEPPESHVDHIAWSPDGTWIVYGRSDSEPDKPPLYQALWRVSTSGGEPMEIYDSGAPEKGVAILHSVSPDGLWVFFWQADILSASILADGVPLYALPAKGGEPIQLADVVLSHSDFVAPAPTGSQMALTVGAGRETWTNKRVALLNLETNDLKYLTGETVSAFSPAFSPDGQWIAYVAAPDVGSVGGGDEANAAAAQCRIWVMNADGSDQRPLTGDPAYRDERPLWSADGTHVLFARLDEDGHASLWLVDAAGGAPEQVVEELTPVPEWFGNYGYIAWNQLFDWWSGSAEQPDDSARAAAPPTATLIPTPTQWFPSTATPTPPPPATPTPRPPAGATPTSATAVKPLPAALVYRTTAGTESEIHVLEPGGADRRVLTLPSHAGHREMAGHYLAYVLDDTIYLADLADGTVRELYGAWGRRAPDFDLCWSSDGRLLAYALAYEEADGSRMVELGTLDGYQQEVVTVLTARPAGPTPTPPAMPPIPPGPGFANLHLLGFNRASNTLAAIPVGDSESHSGVWLIDTLSGERLTTIPLHQPDQTSALALSPDLTRLALCHVGSGTVQSRLEMYDVTRKSVAPAVCDLPPRSHAVDLRWSPDGASLAYLLAEGQPDLAVSPTSGLWLLDVNRVEVRELLQLERPEARLIGWAPDGKALLVEWLDGLSRERHHQLVEVATGQVEDISLPSGVDVMGWASQVGDTTTPEPLPTSPPLFTPQPTTTPEPAGG